MANKIRSQRELTDIKLNVHKKVPPITNATRKPNKLKITDPLVATVEKTEVPNHVLNTSIKKFTMYLNFSKMIYQF